MAPWRSPLVEAQPGSRFQSHRVVRVLLDQFVALCQDDTELRIGVHFFDSLGKNVAVVEP